MKNYKIRTSFVRSECPKAQSNITGITFMIFLLIFVINFCNTKLYMIFLTQGIFSVSKPYLKRKFKKKFKDQFLIAPRAKTYKTKKKIPNYFVK